MRRAEGPTGRRWSRREFLWCSLAGASLGGFGLYLNRLLRRPAPADVFIARASDYRADLAGKISEGLRQLGVSRDEIRGKRILLKPNVVEARVGATHIATHPAVIVGAAEAFRQAGAREVIVAEGPGHNRDTLLALELSGIQEALTAARLPFVDLNEDDLFSVPNRGGATTLKTLSFPVTLREVDWVVSLAKMKTHHWAGVTLSMKNLFGVMPGRRYGWPKNVLHQVGIERAVFDINATLRPHFALVDGIVGMEGDGPIMGTPKAAGVLVLGRNPTAVDATSARIMGVDPEKVPYLAASATSLGPIDEARISQHGEPLSAVRTRFALVPGIPAHDRLV